MPRYWPEFAAAGKDGGHGADAARAPSRTARDPPPLPAEAMYDWERMTTVLAAEPPWWEPGPTHGYHVNTFGFLVGEVVRRVSGESIGDVLPQQRSPSRSAADFQFGHRPEDDGRVAEYVFEVDRQCAGGPPEDEPRRRGRAGPAVPARRVYFNPPGISGLGTVNTTRLARGGDAVDQRPRDGPLRSPASTPRWPAAGVAVRWSEATIEAATAERPRDRLRPRPPVALRPRLPAHAAGAPARPRPAQLRPLRRRRLARLRRPRRSGWPSATR